MRPPKHNVRGEFDLAGELDTAYKKRKQEQTDNKQAYAKALGDLKDVVREEEGPHMRAELRGERTDWVTHVIETTKEIPEDLEGFYPDKFPEDEAKAAEEAAKAEGKDKKADKKDDKKDKKGKKGKKGKEEGGGESKEEELPLLQGKTELTTAMAAEIGAGRRGTASRARIYGARRASRRDTQTGCLVLVEARPHDARRGTTRKPVAWCSTRVE